MKKLDSSDSSTVLTSNVQQQQQQQILPQRRRSTQQQGHRTGRREATTTAATTATTTTTTLTSSRNKNRRRRKRSNNNDHLFSSSISFEQLLLKYWNLYRRFVHSNHIHLELLDEGLCRLLFWIPHHETISSSSGTWREILFGLLSINRLLMDCSQYTKLYNSYGTSVEIDQPNIPATSIRIALSVIHCLMPSLLGIMITTTTSNIIKDENDDANPNNIIGGEGNTMIMSSSSIQQRQTYLRFCLEKIKFILRLYLLVSYWKQYAEQQQQQQQDGSDSSSLSKKASASASTRSCIPMGILLDGGMFYDNQPQGLSEIERRNLERRFQYVGRRTGLKLPVEITTPQSSSTSSTTSSTATAKTKQTIVAELLYALRPLYWAYNEYKHYHSLQQQDYDCDDVNERQQRRRPSLSLLKGWLTTLTMDMISLRLLSFSQQQQQQQQNQSKNRQQHHHWSSKELKRRKMKLFLYLLRSPFWSHITSPMILTKASNLLRNYIPMFGGLIDTCLWDWILYHKQAYVSEEG